MQATTRHRLGGALVALAFVAGGCSPAADEGTAPSPEFTDVDEFIVALPADTPVVEASYGGGMIGYPDRTVRLWKDGRYTVTFGTVRIPILRRSVDALSDVSVEGSLDGRDVRAFLTELMAWDLDQVADRIAATRCPDVIDGGSSTYHLASPTSRREIRPCAAWSIPEYPPPLDAADVIARAALEQQADLVDSYKRYGERLSYFEGADWTAQGLVTGAVARIDPAEPRLAFVADEILAGSVELRRYALVGDRFTRVRPDEIDLLENAVPGDRVVALIDEDQEVIVMGFLDAFGDLIVTDPSHSVLSLGHLGEVAARYELYNEVGVTCEVSEYFRPEPDVALDPLEGLVGIGTRREAVALRKLWLSEQVEALRALPAELTVTFTGLAPNEIVILTTLDGEYLTHARPNNRVSRTVPLPVPPEDTTVIVWLGPDRPAQRCNRVEFGPLAPLIGEVVIEIPARRLPKPPEVPGDPTESLVIDLETGDYSVEP